MIKSKKTPPKKNMTKKEDIKHYIKCIKDLLEYEPIENTLEFTDIISMLDKNNIFIPNGYTIDEVKHLIIKHRSKIGIKRSKTDTYKASEIKRNMGGNPNHTEIHYEQNYKFGEKNFYTTLVEDLMTNLFDEKTKETYKRISENYPDRKREFILSKLDMMFDISNNDIIRSTNKNGKFNDIKKIYGDTKIRPLTSIQALKDYYVPKMEHVDDVVNAMRDYISYGMAVNSKIKALMKNKEFAEKYREHQIFKSEQFGEVPTPLKVVEEMLDVLPKNVWKNPHLKWLDPCVGIGPYLICVIKRLMRSLENYVDDNIDLRLPEIRYKHIIENMIYACEIQPKNIFLYMFFVDPYDQYKLNIYPYSYLESGFDKYMKSVCDVKKFDKFDIILGNPPYQEMDGGYGASAKALYNLFTEKSISLSTNVIFITPSRWFAGGKGLDSYRKFMLNCKKIELIKHYKNDGSIFPDVDLPGGVSYFLFNNDYNGDCLFNDFKIDLSKHEILLSPENYILVDKVKDYESIANICNGSNFYKVDYREGRGERIKDNKLTDDYIKCYTSQQKGFEKWIDKKYLENIDLSIFRVATPRANGENPNFGNIFIVNPNECTTDTYITFNVNSLKEAESLKSYLGTKFANKILSLRKISQDIKPDTCKWIPIIPFDRNWTDEQVFEYFNIQEEEKKIILNS